MKILPRKLSKLLALSLHDLKKAERDPRYVVKMDKWHRPFGKKCRVCQAGAVMAFSLGVSPRDYFYPLYDRENMRQLLAVDHLRRGKVECAAFALDVPYTKKFGELNRYCPKYADDREGFWKVQRKLLKDLRKAGL